MAGDTPVTLIGNLTADPEPKNVSGATVVNFDVASTPRTFDRTSNEWVDGETLFMPCSVWRDQAENFVDSLRKGMRVIVTGRLKSRSWEQDGQRRTRVELEVDELGPSLRYATAAVTKRAAGPQQGGGQRQAPQQGGQQYGGQQYGQPADASVWAPQQGGQPAQGGGFGGQQYGGQPAGGGFGGPQQGGGFGGGFGGGY